MASSGERAKEHLPHLVPQFFHQPLYNLLDDLAGHLFRLRRDEILRSEEDRDKLDIFLQVRERLLLEKELLEPLSLDGILLDDRDDVLPEEASQVREPYRQLGRQIRIGAAKTRTSLRLPVNELKCRVHVYEVAAIEAPSRQRKAAPGDIQPQATEGLAVRARAVRAAAKAQPPAEERIFLVGG